MIVCNASPLIALANLNMLSLLDQIYVEWCVPGQVALECIVDQKPFAELLKKFISGKSFRIENLPRVEALSLIVDKGEAEVIALAEEKQAPRVLMDDAKGRRLAKARGLEVVGTIGTLLRGKKMGIVPSVKQALEKLQESGIRVSAELISEALKLSNEA